MRKDLEDRQALGPFCSIGYAQVETECSQFTPGASWVYGGEYYAITALVCAPLKLIEKNDDDALLEWKEFLFWQKEKKWKYSCPFCGSFASIKSSSIVYGKDHGPILVCSALFRGCESYVGCHQTSKGVYPLGTMANPELRAIRRRCHRTFDVIWQRGIMKRGEAYKWMAKTLGISGSQAHIAMLSKKQCKVLIEKSFAVLNP